MSAGLGLVWRRQAVLWWIFAVNLVCGALGATPGIIRAHRALLHTFASQPLTNRFDVGMFVELVRLPDVRLTPYSTTSFLFAFVFAVFMLFVMGGVLESYRDDRRLTAGEFFAASGTYFWPFVRLLLLSMVPFLLVAVFYQSLDEAAQRIGDRAVADQVGVFLGWGATLVALLLALVVRLWFDIARVRAAAQGEGRMWRNLWRAWRITRHELGRLFWIYLRIALVAWLVLLLAAVIWTRLPATATGAVFVLLELLMLVQIATRLWQLASATAWYQQHAEMVPAEVVAFPAVPHKQTAEVQPAATLEEIVVRVEAAPNAGDSFIPPAEKQERASSEAARPEAPAPKHGPELPPQDT